MTLLDRPAQLIRRGRSWWIALLFVLVAGALIGGLKSGTRTASPLDSLPVGSESARVVELQAKVAAADAGERATLRGALADALAQAHSDHLGAVAAEFDAIHSVERALAVGSVNRIIPAAQLRPLLIDAVERGMARELDRLGVQI